jgi:hypothetical protein
MTLRPPTPLLGAERSVEATPAAPPGNRDQPAGLCLDGSWLLASREKKRAHSSWRYIARTCKGRFMQQRDVAYDLVRSSTSSIFEKRSDPRRTGAAAVSRAHVVSTPSRTSTTMSRRAIAMTNAASSPRTPPPARRRCALSCRVAVAACQRGSQSSRAGLACGSSGAVAGSRKPSSYCQPCHKRAIHRSLDRSPADTHGQHHSGRDLRRSLLRPVTILLGLALQARGHGAALGPRTVGNRRSTSDNCGPSIRR